MLLKVMSTKTVFGDKEKILKTVMQDDKREHLLYRVYGVIEGHAIGKGKHKRIDKETGEAVDTFWTKFFGDFEAVNASDGEVFNSAVCFLPDYVSGQFVTALAGEGEMSITFAYDIYARYNKDAITSYEFIASPVKRADEKDKLAEMRAALPAAKTMPALADQRQGQPEAAKKGK